jgi:uncharacterized protein (DUF58 family)
MWKSFMTSIGLLAIAMIAALYSSGAARDGRVLASAVAAILALIMAIWVGIKFVPRLASRIDWEWLPFFLHYQVTREGWMYFVAILVVVFAAVNTANNLLYMVLSALLAVLVLAGLLSALNFRCVGTSVRIPSQCYAGEPFPMTIRVENEKRLFPTFSVFFEPVKDCPFRFSTFYVSLIRGQQQVSQTGQAMLARRGRYTLRMLKGSSRYPFGFLLKYRNYRAEAECICYPELLPKERLNIGSIDLRGSQQRFERGLGHDLHTIRDYLPSDSARHVHWKASAKTATLKTREYAAEQSRRLVLALDRFGTPDDAPRFEYLVSQAASLALHLINDGIEVRFVTDEWEGDAVEPILEYLALVEMSSGASVPRVENATLRLSLRK